MANALLVGSAFGEVAKSGLPGSGNAAPARPAMSAADDYTVYALNAGFAPARHGRFAPDDHREVGLPPRRRASW